MVVDPRIETLVSDTEFFAIGNEIGRKHGATIIKNPDCKVFSSNMARDAEAGANLEEIEREFNDIGFVRFFTDSFSFNLDEGLISRGFKKNSEQIGFWLDIPKNPLSSDGVELVPVVSESEKKQYLDFHTLEAREHKTPEDVIDIVGVQRLNKIHDPRMKWFLVVENAIATGSIGILFLAHSARIKNPYTIPELRGRGLGVKACNAVIEMARQNGLSGVSVYAQPGSGGHKLYSKIGFREVLRHNIFIKFLS
jgi:GNAT superfamily N-acetyltransferase